MNAIAPDSTVVDAIHRIPLAEIDRSGRVRPVNAAKVKVIQSSILAKRSERHSGQDTPILVRPIDGAGPCRYKLVYGAHRCDALEGLGDSHIESLIRPMTDKEARLAELDENLARNELTKFERAAFLAERDTVWKELYPETKRGKAGAAARWGHATDKMSFAEDIQERVDLSPKQIRRDVDMWRHLSLYSRTLIPGTWLADHQAQLKALAKCGPELQAKVLDALLRTDKPAASVAEAVAEVEGRRKVEPAPDEQRYNALKAAWDRANQRVRDRFLDQLNTDGALDRFRENPRVVGSQPAARKGRPRKTLEAV